MRIFTAFIFSILISISGCNYADMGGMFITTESINDRFRQSMETNNKIGYQEFNIASDEYQLFAMADVHIGGTENFDKALEQIKLKNATALILDGDICNGNDYDYEKLVAHLPDESELKTFLIAGNHELYFGGWKHYYKYFGTSSYYFSVNTPTAKDLYMCLDTGSGTLGSLQLNWFENTMKQIRSNFRHCIIFTHNNLYRIRHTTSTNPVSKELIALTALFAHYNVKIVITGHDHVKNVVQLGNTTHITMNAMVDGFSNAGYLELKVKGESAEYNFIDL